MHDKLYLLPWCSICVGNLGEINNTVWMSADTTGLPHNWCALCTRLCSNQPRRAAEKKQRCQDSHLWASFFYSTSTYSTPLLSGTWRAGRSLVPSQLSISTNNAEKAWWEISKISALFVLQATIYIAAVEDWERGYAGRRLWHKLLY